MYRVSVFHTLDGLLDDLKSLPAKEAKEMTAVVRDGAKIGNQLARDNARQQHTMRGDTDKHYPNSMTSELKGRFGHSSGAIYSAEYGPVVGRMQGSMSFERGSRNQPPHFDLARSADVIGPAMVREVRDALDRMFW